MTSVPTFKLNTGQPIPSIGMGCWMGEPGPGIDQEIVRSLGDAFKVGYRHIDTANMYQNEREVGQAIRESGLPREEIFLTTKLNPKQYHNVVEGFEGSLRDLDVGYIDLYLMHWPQGLRASDGRAYGDVEGDIGPTFNQVWAEMEKLLETHKGKVRAIGVSNFSPKNLNKLLKTAKVVPAANQIENHPYLPEEELVELCNEHGILVTAYSPLGQSNSPILTDPDLAEIAKAHGTSNAVVALSWLVQRGISAVPKSSNKDRMTQNITLVKLTEQEMERISKIHHDPKRCTRLLSGLPKEGKILGWTLDQLGFDVGFDVHGLYLQPSYKDPAKASGKGIPSAINNTVTRFYELTDTPDVHEDYSKMFIDDPSRLSFQIGPMEATHERKGIFSWRENAWKGVTRRKHVLNGIFISPENGDAIMLDGTGEIDKEGKTIKLNWAGRMVFDHDSLEDGRPLIESYKVWVEQV